MIKKSFYHQSENTSRSELSTYLYDYNSWEFNSLHFHKNYEVIVVQKGECVCTVGEIDYTLQQGDAIFILPFQIHAFHVCPDAAVRCVTFSELLILTMAKSVLKKKNFTMRLIQI